MSCPEISFPDVDDVLYARLLQQAMRAGAKFSQDSENRMEISGAELTWRRDGTTLFVTCQKKPFFASCEAVKEKLTELLDQARSAQ